MKPRTFGRCAGLVAVVVAIAIAIPDAAIAATKADAAVPTATPPAEEAGAPSSVQPAETAQAAPVEKAEQESSSVAATESSDSKTVADETAKASKPKKTGKIVGALVGAGIGALVGRHGNAAQGAVIGAMAGLLAGAIFDEYTVRRTKSADAVNDEYKKANGGVLPTATTVTKYTTRIEPQAVVVRGGEVQFVSDIEIVRGTAATSQADVIEQELILLDPSGQGEKRVRKPAVESATESGAYSTQFLFKPAKGATQGQYQFKTVLYVNGEKVDEQAGTIQIAAVEPLTKERRVG